MAQEDHENGTRGPRKWHEISAKENHPMTWAISGYEARGPSAAMRHVGPQHGLTIEHNSIPRGGGERERETEVDDTDSTPGSSECT
jgi:hypothetical protein